MVYFSVAVSNERYEPINDTPTSSPYALGEMAMSLVCHYSVVAPLCNIWKGLSVVSSYTTKSVLAYRLQT